MKTRCPRPLDEGDAGSRAFYERHLGQSSKSLATPRIGRLQPSAATALTVDYTSDVGDGLLEGKKKMQPLELLTAASAAAGGLVLAGRYLLRAWSLYQLRTLARESHAIERCWSVIAELPAEVQTQPLRCTLGRIMYQHLKRARRIQPDHPYLRAQLLQIARFIGRTPRDEGRRLAGATRGTSMAALGELRRLLSENAAEGLISYAELTRCGLTVSQALVRLEFDHCRRAALQAEFLRRTPQAIQYLRSAMQAARRFGDDSSELREVAARLELLEAAEPVMGMAAG